MEAESSYSDENRRQSSVSFKESETQEGSTVEPGSPTPKVPKKFINSWKQACDRTKDRTKELLKKWRTLPEAGHLEDSVCSQSSDTNPGNSNKWTEHVWSTWVKRSPKEETSTDNPESTKMTEIQRKKFSHYFISYLDLDRDDVISLTDFDAFSERLRHFSDWANNSSEYHRLKEVQRGFIETFLLPEDLDGSFYSYEALEKKIKKEQLSLDVWLDKWNTILNQCQTFYELPLWLQYFPKILFRAINKSGTGIVTKNELSEFFFSLLGLTKARLEPFATKAFQALTSNNHHPLNYSVYRLCFANFIFARYPNGPGQYIFGPISGIENCWFPIDYRVLTCTSQELEQYSPDIKSKRRSIIV